MRRVALLALVASFAPAAATASPDVTAAAVPPSSVPASSVPTSSVPTSSAPVLLRVEFVDRVYFREETLLGFVRSPLDEPVDTELLAQDAAGIADQYRARGFLQAQVDIDVVPVDALVTPGARAVVARFVVRAGERAEVKVVEIVGNDLVDDAALQEGLFTRPAEPLGALTRAGLFHRPYLDQDGQRLVLNYYRHGFLEARVLDTRVTAAPDLGGLAVTFAVVEGPRYELASLRFVGDLPEAVTSDAWRARLALADGAPADLVTVQQQSDPLLDVWRERGHPFARIEQQMAVVPAPSGDPDRRGVALTLKVIKGPPAVVRAVRVVGHKGTMEHVLRRELVVAPGQPYDHRAVKLSERQLMQTGILQAAQGRAVPVDDAAADGAAAAPPASPPASPPAGSVAVDVEFTVTETTTWLLSPAVFGDANEGLIFIGVAGDRNLLGSGLQAFASVQWSALRFLFDASLTEPRLFGTRSSATWEAHRRELRYEDFTIRSILGSSLRANYAYELGFRLGGPARLFTGGGVGVEFGGVVPREDLRLAASPLLPQDVFRNVVELRGGFDTREGGLSPRNGVLVSVEAATAGPWTASGLAFLDGQANVRAFWSPVWDVTFKTNTQLGAAMNPLGGDVPVTDRYFLGGLGAVRGFFPRSIGPRRSARLAAGDVVDVAAGGVVKVVQNVEVEAPLWPGTPFRGFAFVDAGNAFGEEELAGQLAVVERGTAALPLSLLWSTGFGVLIETPVLPFRLEWSVPLTRRAIDQPINFFLGVGSAF